AMLRSGNKGQAESKKSKVMPVVTRDLDQFSKMPNPAQSPSFNISAISSRALIVPRKQKRAGRSAALAAGKGTKSRGEGLDQNRGRSRSLSRKSGGRVKSSAGQ